MKKLFIALAIIVITGVATAFTVQNKANKAPKASYIQEWFVFNGVAGQENDPIKYSLVSGDPNCPSFGAKRCAIYGTRQTGSNPVIPDLTKSYTVFTKP